MPHFLKKNRKLKQNNKTKELTNNIEIHKRKEEDKRRTKTHKKKYKEHKRQVKLVCEKAESIGAEFNLKKSNFAGETAEYWGFIHDSEGRRPSPGKIAQLAEWPDYECIDDVRSHVHFVEYLKEFIPDLPNIIYPLRKYLKKGATFDS